ncbi:Splicing factor 3A subunit 3 [Tupaia chinensis]|uniref:Splicing factor 3A subunit 3 n=1 Tax=Tupaia chinensis TaxID=246437 RepID=L9L8Q6_TUPCH|nr:Splicing factor 3A subunit 3 [Tupaia chinensis]
MAKEMLTEKSMLQNQISSDHHTRAMQDRVKQIEKLHQKHPNEICVPMSVELVKLLKTRENPSEEAENLVEFTDEEGYGSYHALHDCYLKYINLKRPKAFQWHFAERRHAHEMRCLGIPNSVHFTNVTQIEDAGSLWAKLKLQKASEQWQPDTEEEYEDLSGKVVNKTYEDLNRQGCSSVCGCSMALGLARASLRSAFSIFSNHVLLKTLGYEVKSSLCLIRNKACWHMARLR